MNDTPTPITDKKRILLLRQWGKMADTLMMRDGTNMRYPNGGHQIKNDPLLTAAIKEIRDGYFKLFNDRCHYTKQPERTVVEIKLQDNDFDLITHNHDSFCRLQEPDYGFSPEEKREILLQANYPDPDKNFPGLTKLDATKIVGTIIKRSILTFELVYDREKASCAVPHVPLVTRAEQMRAPRSCEPDSAGRLGKGGWRDALCNTEAGGILHRS